MYVNIYVLALFVSQDKIVIAKVNFGYCKVLLCLYGIDA